MKKYILSIDQGTSSTKALLFDEAGNSIARGVELLHTHYGDDGFVEQDPEAIYSNALAAIEKCLAEFSGKGFSTKQIAIIGISNQRETFVVWDQSGKPLYNAVVWQCKRSVDICTQLKENGLSAKVNERTGLLIDPYFSATKLIWLNQHVSAVKNAIASGNAYFGTIDTWLLYKLTNGKVYATDHTNASRTLFFNIHSLDWDAELIADYGLTGIHLPQVFHSSYAFGSTTCNNLLEEETPIHAMLGDSHAAAFGEGCISPGTAKATMGTGCSILMNIGSQPISSANGMVTTICWSSNGRVDYALEGVIVSCGATIEWLKHNLGLFESSAATESMATAVPDNGGVYLIPSFSGLGSPHWQMHRKAAIMGLRFGSNKNHIVRAALESIVYQVKDVISAMEKDAGINLVNVSVDGGITHNRFVMQLLADVLCKNVSSIGMADVSALGAALMAGIGAGIFNDMEAVKQVLKSEQQYSPGDVVKAKEWHEAWLNYINNTIATD